MDIHRDEGCFGSGWWDRPRWLGATGSWAVWLGRHLTRDKDSDWVVKRYEENVATQIRRFGPDGGPTANARSLLAMELESGGRIAEAQLLRREVLNAYRRNRDAEDRDVLGAEEGLAVNLAESGMFTEARPLFEHVRDVRGRILGSDDSDTLRPARWLSAMDQAEQNQDGPN